MEREREEAEAQRRLEASELQSELRMAERQCEAAAQVQGNTQRAQERLAGTVHTLESEHAEKVRAPPRPPFTRAHSHARVSHQAAPARLHTHTHTRFTHAVPTPRLRLRQVRELHRLEAEHTATQRRHAALATEAAVKTQLLEQLGSTARELALSSDACNAVLTVDLAACEVSARTANDARWAAVAELRAERSEHEACRLQLISAQAALQAARADSAQALAAEGVRLILLLDELRRADRLASVIHRSLNDAIRGSAEVHRIQPLPTPPPAAAVARHPRTYLSVARLVVHRSRVCSSPMPRL